MLYAVEIPGRARGRVAKKCVTILHAVGFVRMRTIIARLACLMDAGHLREN